MKKVLIISTVLMFVFSSLSLTGEALAAPSQDQVSLSFFDLGQTSEIVMRGPFDVASFRFSLPASWNLQGGAVIELVASSYFASNDKELAALEQTGNYVGSLLDISFNGKLQRSIPLIAGENVSYQIPVSVADLASTNRDGSLEISFFLNASIDCDNNFHHTTVMISTDSLLQVDYSEVGVKQDLRRLPWPLYQAGPGEQESAYVVVPSSPSADEMQAALVSMAAFGRMTRRNLPVKLISVDDLKDNLRQESNLILVGKPASFPFLAEVAFPVPVAGSGFKEIEESDGIVQQVASPWNQTKTILLISGSDDQGVVKAAQALSTGNILTGNSPSYSVVSQINPEVLSSVLGIGTQTITATEVPFSDIGYETETLSGIGAQYAYLEFVIPPGQQVVESPYMTLKFSHSTLIDSERSEGVVYVNDLLVGGFKLSTEESNNVTVDVKLPVSVFRPGLNSIDLVVSLIPRDVCSVGTLDGLWVTISQDSLLHLPLRQETDMNYSRQDLYSYPYPFANAPTLDTTAFVIPGNDSGAWTIAGSIAYDLGGLVSGPIFLFETAFDGQIQESLQNKNLILVGQPKDLNIDSKLKDTMPAYFEDGSNLAVLEAQQVIYRIAPDKSLGYLEIFPSPWTDNSLVLGVFGTTPDGLNNAAMSLLQPQRLDVLRGDFATVDGEKSIIVDTRTGLGMGRVAPELGTSVTVENQPTQQPSIPIPVSDNRPMILIGLTITAALMVLIVAIALWIRKRNL